MLTQNTKAPRTRAGLLSGVRASRHVLGDKAGGLENERRAVPHHRTLSHTYRFDDFLIIDV